MSRIARTTLKIFASTATNIGQFGSGQTGAKLLSTDVTVLQALAAWVGGWSSAVLGTKKFPPIEEMNSSMYVLCTFLAYILQQGIPEYDSGTTYYQNGMVAQPGTYRIYGSKTDGNVGNVLTDTTNWQFLSDLSATIGAATESTSGILKIATVAEVAAGTDDTSAVTPLKLSTVIVPTGGLLPYAFSSGAPAGWVYCSPLTIGNAASGATNLASATTQQLFTGLWNEFSNSMLPIQDSSGAATSRGLSAAADYAANKRLPCLDARGRVIAGLDNMGGTPAGRLTGQPGGVSGTVNGSGGGQELHQLIVSEMPSHTHPIGSDNGANGLAGGGCISATISPPQATRGAMASTGGDAPHNNVQPTLVLPILLKL